MAAPRPDSIHPRARLRDARRRRRRSTSCRCSGELPRWLSGSLLRTGPARFEVGDAAATALTDAPLVRRPGDAAPLHDLRRRASPTATATSRAAPTAPPSRAGGSPTASSRPIRAARCSSACRRMFAPGQSISDNANVNVTKLGERFIAMTETPLPVQFDARTLQAADVAPYRAPGELTTAHPHLDRATGGMLNYAAKLGPRSSYRFFGLGPERVQAAGARQAAGPRARLHALLRPDRALDRAGGVPARRQPARAGALAAGRTSRTTAGSPSAARASRWSTARPARRSRRSTGEPCFAFHHVNAFEQDGRGGRRPVRLPRRRASSRTSTSSGCAPDEPVRGADADALPPAGIRSRRRSSAKRLAEEDLELPRIDYGAPQRAPLPLRVGQRHRRRAGWLERISKVDTESRAPRSSWPQPGLLPRRAGVRRAPRRARTRTTGVLLSVVLDADAQQLVPARARRRRPARARARRASPPRPVRLPRAVRPRLTRTYTATALSSGHSPAGSPASGWRRRISYSVVRSAAGRPARVRGGDQLGRVELDAVVAAGEAADRLLHQRPAEVVDAPAQRLGGGVEAHLHPARLHARDRAAEREAEHGGVLEVLLARDLLHAVGAAEQRLEGDERQRHELGDPAGALLQLAHDAHVLGQLPRLLDVAEHHRRGRAQAGARGRPR